MTHDDVAEGVNDALVGNNPIGECELPAGFVKCVRHNVFLSRILMMRAL